MSPDQKKCVHCIELVMIYKLVYTNGRQILMLQPYSEVRKHVITLHTRELSCVIVTGHSHTISYEFL